MEQKVHIDMTLLVHAFLFSIFGVLFQHASHLTSSGNFKRTKVPSVVHFLWASVKACLSGFWFS